VAEVQGLPKFQSSD